MCHETAFYMPSLVHSSSTLPPPPHPLSSNEITFMANSQRELLIRIKGGSSIFYGGKPVSEMIGSTLDSMPHGLGYKFFCFSTDYFHNIFSALIFAFSLV